MSRAILDAERAHLSSLLEAIQRCIFFLDASKQKLSWPLQAGKIQDRKRDIDLFESLAAINERFSKLQDTLGSAMRHAALLAGEPVDSFLKVLSFYEKCGVIESMEAWQIYRATRNLAAHDYETDYAAIAGHFNTLHELLPELYGDAANFISYCKQTLAIDPESRDFEKDFLVITQKKLPVKSGHP